MRIVAGCKRGLRLASVGRGDASAHLRPTSDRVRENIFNMLLGGKYGDPVSNARVLDLFAGTGALGLEALSRGASSVTFIDNGSKALSLIHQNIGLFNAQGKTKVWRRNVADLDECRQAPFDLVFLDPPYGKGMGEKTLVACLSGGWIGSKTLCVLEEGQTISAPVGFKQLDCRTYGDTFITFLKPIE